MLIIDGEKHYVMKEIAMRFCVSIYKIRKIVTENNIPVVMRRMNLTHCSPYTYVSMRNINKIGVFMRRNCTICGKVILNYHGNRKNCPGCRIRNTVSPQKAPKYKKNPPMPKEEFDRRWDEIMRAGNNETERRISNILSGRSS